jgi:hypothetical protein
MTRAKFTVQRIERSLHWQREKGEVQTVVMTPVSDNSPENKKFFEATPSGELKIGLLNAEAAKLFELGKSYYVDFSPAE